MVGAAPRVDLNSDLGEGFGHWRLGDDDGLLDVVTSANVACGFHAGDPSIMRRVCEGAALRGVAVGAQVGYRDLVGFGRRYVDVDPDELTQDVVYQVGALQALAHAAGTRVTYVKPHGALYNAIARDQGQAAAVVRAVVEVDASLVVLGSAGSAWLRLAAAAGLTVVHEAFADRAYTADGELVPRSLPGAVLSDVDEVVRRCLAMARGEAVPDVDGAPIFVAAQSLCVHGDTPGAVEVARAVRAALTTAGVDVRAFAP